MFEPREIADKADVIIAGFAVVVNENDYSVYDLNDCEGVAIFLPDRQLLETKAFLLFLTIRYTLVSWMDFKSRRQLLEQREDHRRL